MPLRDGYFITCVEAFISLSRLPCGVLFDVSFMPCPPVRVRKVMASMRVLNSMFTVLCPPCRILHTVFSMGVSSISCPACRVLHAVSSIPCPQCRVIHAMPLIRCQQASSCILHVMSTRQHPLFCVLVVCPPAVSFILRPRF